MLISPSIFGASISNFGICPSILGAFISIVGILILGTFISTSGIFISPSIFGAFKSITGISILGPLISIPGIFISNFLPLSFLTPTVTSGIFNIFLFNIIGSSTLPLNIVLIFKGSACGILLYFTSS